MSLKFTHFNYFAPFITLLALLFLACAEIQKPTTACKGVDKCSLDKKCLAKECEQKNAFSCKLLADEYWYDGEPMDCFRQTDTKQARLYYQKACDLGFAEGCEGLGYTMNEKNLCSDESVVHFEKACAMDKTGEICGGIGTSCEIVENYKQALRFFAKACDLKYANACKDKGVLLLYLYDTQYTKEALEFFNKGCEFGYFGSCEYLAVLYKEGIYGVKQDLDRAKKYYQKSCDLRKWSECDGFERITCKLFECKESVK